MHATCWRVFGSVGSYACGVAGMSVCKRVCMLSRVYMDMYLWCEKVWYGRAYGYGCNVMYGKVMERNGMERMECM